jgi:nitrogen PTS system EIIA component
MILTLSNAAQLLQVSEDQVSRWVQSEGLPSRTVQDRIQFDRIELLEWAWHKKRPICPSVASANGGTWTPMLASALELGGIHYHLPGRDKGEVYRSLIDALPLPETVDADHLWQVLMARESICPTGMGDGIAIPHPRNPVVLHVEQPVFAIGFPEVPIADFGAIDNRPVKTLLMIISPTVRMHLRILASLTAALHAPELVRCLDQRARPEELIATIDRVDRSSTAARATTAPAPAGEARS